MAYKNSYLYSLSPLDIRLISIVCHTSLKVASCSYCKTLFLKNIHNKKFCKRKCVEINYRRNNLDKFRRNTANYRKRNPNSDKTYLLNNPDKRKQTTKKYRDNNKEKRKVYNKNWIKNNPDKRRKIRSRHHNKRRKNDIDYKLKCDIKSRISSALKNNIKCAKTMELLGCSVEFARDFLESKFVDGMSWDNYGKDTWHIDHIVPVSSFDFSKEEDQRRCFHYTNLQPLWALDNLLKSDKVVL